MVSLELHLEMVVGVLGVDGVSIGGERGVFVGDWTVDINREGT